MAFSYRLKVLAGSLTAGALCYGGWRKFSKSETVRRLLSRSLCYVRNCNSEAAVSGSLNE